jgi:hypothetical protein
MPLQSSDVPLFEAIASYCRLTFHSYLWDGCWWICSWRTGYQASLLKWRPSTPRSIWGSSCVESNSRYGWPAFQVVWFLQRIYIYGFVVNDYDYESMLAYGNLARSFVVLEATLAQYLLYVYLQSHSPTSEQVNMYTSIVCKILLKRPIPILMWLSCCGQLGYAAKALLICPLPSTCFRAPRGVNSCLFWPVY